MNTVRPRILVLAAALLLRVRDQDQVCLDFYPKAALPPLCMSREWFGISCPGCGLTRSFVYLAHGEWLASWQAHRFGWLLAGALFLQIPYRIYRLKHLRMSPLSLKMSKWFGFVLIALLVGNWLIGLIP